MSNELQLTVSLSFSKGNARLDRSESISVDITGDSIMHNTQVIGTTEEQIVVPSDLTTYGYIFIRNLDSTNFIEVGRTTGVYNDKLKAGEFLLKRCDGNTLYAKADTASCNTEIIVIEE